MARRQRQMCIRDSKKDTQPLVDFYNEKNLVNVIDAVGEVEDIYNSISRHFK